jgi:hypothetical protein
MKNQDIKAIAGEYRSSGWANGYIPVTVENRERWSTGVDKRNGKTYIIREYQTSQSPTQYVMRDTWWAKEDNA